MLARVLSSAVSGIEAYIVEVETDLYPQLPSFATVELPDNAVKESRERVQSVIKNSGYYFPSKKITISLAPADVKKEGSAFDLPIAIGIIAATGQINWEKFDEYIILGELSLEGTLRPVHGALPMALSAQKNGLKGMILPKENAKEAAMAEKLNVYAVESLRQAIEFLESGDRLKPFKINIQEVFEESLGQDMNCWITRPYRLFYELTKNVRHLNRTILILRKGNSAVGQPHSQQTFLCFSFPIQLHYARIDGSPWKG